MNVARFRKKPIEVEAMQINDFTKLAPDALSQEAKRFLEDIVLYGDSDSLFIHTLEGDMEVCKGDWIIKGVKGEFYPCKDEIFKMSYESVSLLEENDG